MNEKCAKRKYSLIIWIVLIAVIIVIWHFYPKPQVSKVKDFERVISTVQPEEQKVRVIKDYIGYVKPINEVVVRPYISGFIKKVLVNGGQKVKTGDILALIDASEYQAKLDSAKAFVAQAQAEYNNRKVFYQRIKKAGAKAVSKTEIDNAKASFLTAEAALEQAQAMEQEAKVNLDYTVIKATIDGVAGNISLSEGDYVSPLKQLFSIIQFTPIRVVFAISDKDYLSEIMRDKMFDGETIRLKLANGKIYSSSGKFQYSDNQIDKGTNSIAVYVNFANPDKQLVANAYVDVLIEKEYSGIVLRKNMVILQADGSYVYVAKKGKLKKHKVEILSEYGENNYVIQNNFEHGQTIVTDKVSASDVDKKFKIILKPVCDAEEDN